jgi:hypothetical protein
MVSKEKKYGAFSAREVETHFLFPHSGTIILITEGVLYLEERQDSFKLLVTK